MELTDCHNIDDFRKLAKRRLPWPVFDYIDGAADDELTKARNKVLSALVIKNELPMGRLVDLGFNWMYLGQYRSVEEDVEAIKAVRVEEVNSLIRELDLSRFTQYSLGPVSA